MRVVDLPDASRIPCMHGVRDLPVSKDGHLDPPTYLKAFADAMPAVFLFLSLGVCFLPVTVCAESGSVEYGSRRQEATSPLPGQTELSVPHEKYVVSPWARLEALVIISNCTAAALGVSFLGKKEPAGDGGRSGE